WKTSGRAGGISPGEARSSRASASPALPGFPRPPALWAGPFPSRKIRAGLVAGRRTGYRFGSVRSKVLRFVSEPSRPRADQISFAPATRVRWDRQLDGRRDSLAGENRAVTDCWEFVLHRTRSRLP